MQIKGFRKYAMNPALGVLPIAVFLILNASFVDLRVAVAVSILTSMLVDAFYRFVLRTTIFGLLTLSVIVPLVLTCVFAIFAPIDNVNPHNYMIICEIWLVLCLFLVRKWKRYIASRYFKRIDIREKSLLQEVFSTIAMTEHLFTFHLFIVLAYSFMFRSYGFDGMDYIVYVVFPLGILLMVIAYESYMLRSLSTRLFKEEWLPIVNEQGRVVGKVAKSVSMKMKNRFLHPVIRIALVCDGAIYLQKRSDEKIFEPGMLDHPFEKYMLFKHDINLSARNSISRQLGGESLPYRFQLKYIFENDQTKRLILFYVSHIQSAAEIRNISLLKGKFWTIKQIEEEIPSNIFGECFLKEFEYLKSTVLNPAILNPVLETTSNN